MTASLVWSARGCASTSSWWPARAGRAWILIAWSAARSARFAGAIRARSSLRTGASAAANVPITVPTATSTCTASRNCGPTRPIPNNKVAVVQQKATMCDLCTDLDGQPSCVYACPHDAAHRYTGEEMLELVKKGV